MKLSVDDLNAFGKARLEDDFQQTLRRDGGKTSRTDFALGWMAAMVRISQRSYFEHWPGGDESTYAHVTATRRPEPGSTRTTRKRK